MSDGMTKLRKSDYIPFLDVNKGSGTESWKRIEKSTIFALDPGVQTEDADYISMETPVTEITGYKPSLPQEVACYDGDPIYDFMFNLFYDLPIGSGVKCPVLLCFGGAAKKAWRLKDATVTLGTLDTVAGKLSFTLNLGGNIERGTYSITAGAPTFTAES